MEEVEEGWSGVAENECCYLNLGIGRSRKDLVSSKSTTLMLEAIKSPRVSRSTPVADCGLYHCRACSDVNEAKFGFAGQLYGSTLAY